MIQTTEEILKLYGCIQSNDDIDKKDAQAAMIEYTISVIDYILTDPSLIYVDDVVDMQALYDTEKWDALKKSLI